MWLQKVDWNICLPWLSLLILDPSPSPIPIVVSIFPSGHTSSLSHPGSVCEEDISWIKFPPYRSLWGQDNFLCVSIGGIFFYTVSPWAGLPQKMFILYGQVVVRGEMIHVLVYLSTTSFLGQSFVLLNSYMLKVPGTVLELPQSFLSENSSFSCPDMLRRRQFKCPGIFWMGLPGSW